MKSVAADMTLLADEALEGAIKASRQERLGLARGELGAS